MTNPRGYADWKPAPETMVVLGQVNEVLREYRAYLPMTARQIFYRLVGQFGFDKTERAYKRLCSYLVRARRARIIPFHSIRDDGTTEEGGGGYSSEAGFWSAVRSSAEYFSLDRQLNQPQEIEIWCEAAGMAPMLARMVYDYSIPVYSTGGFSSVTVTHEVADRVVRRGRRGTPTVFLHVGDYDPSGVSIFESMAEDIGAFVASKAGGLYYNDGGVGRVEGYFLPERVALTRDQVAEHDLPTAPPKSSDSRSANWYDETTQLEAMPPDLLEETILAQVHRFIDEDIYQDTLARETEARDHIAGVLEEVDES